MPIQLPIRGGADWKSRVAPTFYDAQASLNEIRLHLTANGKAKGVLVLVDRTNEHGPLKLERKSSLQLLFRGRNNQRLNDTVETIGKLLTKAGLHDAKQELDDYLAAGPNPRGNRISAAKLLEILNKYTSDEPYRFESSVSDANSDESGSSIGSGRIVLEGPFESVTASEVQVREGSVSDEGPIILADGEPISVSELRAEMNRYSAEANAASSMEMHAAAEQQVDHGQQAVQQQAPEPVPKQVPVQEQEQVQVQVQVPVSEPAQAQVQSPVQAPVPSPVPQQAPEQRPRPYAGADLYPPKTTGRTMPELLRNANMQKGEVLGHGAFGQVWKLNVQGQPPMVLKTFKPGEQPMLSRRRNGDANEAIAAYLTSKKDGTYADRVNVVQPEYYLVQKAGTSMMLDPLALRAMLKDPGNVRSGLRCTGLVMKKAEGQELMQLAGKLPLEHQKQVFRETVRSISVLNERGFIHRDIKSENTFYDPVTGKVSLIDTGMLHKRSKRLPQSATVDNLAGTPSFMHPKIWRGEPYGTEADLYSAAMMALEVHSPLTMRLIEKVYVQPLSKALKRGETISGIRLFNRERLRNTIDKYLAALPMSGGTSVDQAERAELEGFKAELADPNSYSSLIMDCLDAATNNGQDIDWRDPNQAAQIYANVLNSSRLN